MFSQKRGQETSPGRAGARPASLATSVAVKGHYQILDRSKLKDSRAQADNAADNLNPVLLTGIIKTLS